MPSIDAILDLLTPESLENTIREIASKSGHDTIAVVMIADRILKEHGAGSGFANSLAHAKLAHKIAEQVTLIGGMRFIENE